MTWWWGLLLLAGLWFLWGVVSTLRVRYWLATPGVRGLVLQSEVVEDGDRYRRHLRYRFELDGVAHLGTRLWPRHDEDASAYASTLSGPLRPFEVGKQVTVYVRKGRPDEAFLSKRALFDERWHGGLGFGTALALGLAVVAGVPGRLHAALGAPTAPWSPLESTETFAAGSLLCLLWLVWRGLLPLRVRLLYRQMPAVVVASHVARMRGTNAPSMPRYAPQAWFSYTVDGIDYESDLLRFDGNDWVTTSERRANKEVALLPPGRRLQVWVHKLDPSFAVLDASLPWESLVIPVLLLAACGAGLHYELGRVGRLKPDVGAAQIHQSLDTALASEGVQLDLSGKGLTRLPPEIAQLNRLERLDLSNNQLTELPDVFAKLPRLRELNLSHNRLSKLPASLCHAALLQVLKASDNHLAATERDWWVQELREAKALQQVELAGNRLDADALIALVQLPRLQAIDLSRNRVVLDRYQLPLVLERTSQARSLVRLDLRDNPKLPSHAVEQLRHALPKTEVLAGKRTPH